MAKKPNGYDETKEYSGSFKALPAGGYVCVIKAIEEMKSRKGYPMFKVAVDIAEGEYKDYFMGVFQKRKERDPMNAKWSNDGIKYVMLEDANGQCSRAFKSFCGALEKCGYTIWDSSDSFIVDNVKGKTIGLTFGREESERNGERRWNTKPQFFCTVDDIRDGNFRTPDDRPLPKAESAFEMPEGFAKVSDDDIPF